MSRLRTRRRTADESGYTLVEVMITTALLLVVMAILAPLLTTTMRTFERQTDRSGALDQAGVMLQQIQHDVYAASVINVVASPNNELQLIAVLPSTTGGGDVQSCIEYRVTSATAPAALALQRQVWALNTAPPATSTWPTLLASLKLNGTGTVAGYVIPNPAGLTPFVSAGTSGQSVNVSIQVQNGTSTINTLTTTATGVIANPSGASIAATTWANEC
jgi:prepilin-type N-terminal cleavage/methylation domain-containing protein